MTKIEEASVESIFETQTEIDSLTQGLRDHSSDPLHDPHPGGRSI